MPVAPLTRGVQIIGDTMFIDGSPHKFCGHCGQVINSSDYERKIVSRGATKSKGKIVKDGKVSYEVKPYAISILIRWDLLGEEVIMVDGFPTLKKHWKPKVIQKPGCFNCWNTQKQSGEYFKIKDCVDPAINLKAAK
tara:strand:- start:94 stop:504 length:411 start_codon:yes stop_codon:yes gene_type:complete